MKQTVNFDAPDVYHLYYGDESGRPGTILTFFPFLNAARGKKGGGETSSVAFSVPSGALDFWIHRLSRNGIAFGGPDKRFGEEFLSFEDPDGMVVELFADSSVDRIPGWAGSAAGPQNGVRRFHGVTFTHRDIGPSGAFLGDVMGFARGGVEGNGHAVPRWSRRGAGPHRHYCGPCGARCAAIRGISAPHRMAREGRCGAALVEEGTSPAPVRPRRR